VLRRTADQTHLQGIFKEYTFFGLDICDVVREILHLDLLAPWDGEEVVEESAD